MSDVSVVRRGTPGTGEVKVADPSKHGQIDFGCSTMNKSTGRVLEKAAEQKVPPLKLS